MSIRKLVSLSLVPVFLAVVGCGSSDNTSVTATGGRGTTGSGGSGFSASGGSSTNGSGGSNGSGGDVGNSSGGSTGSGGSVAGTGGSSTGTGGATATGGSVSGTGGRAAGGASSTGGSVGGGGATATGNEFWISPTGKDTNPGTKDAPRFTLCDDTLKTGGCYNICPVGAGCLTTTATIWVMDGTYAYGAVTQKIGSSKLGTATAAFNVFAVPGAHPVFDFTGQPVGVNNRGIQLNGDYWHIKGITVTKAGDSGIFVTGNNNTIDQCIIHHNQDTGLQIGVNSMRPGSGMNNLILNCDSYQNNDVTTNGANADGFGAKESTGTGNVFDGCRSWDNADDGYDLFGWTSPITIKNSWAFNEGGTTAGSQSNGNGFKMGGNKVPAAHMMSNLFAFDNNGNGGHKSDWGFTNNSNPTPMTCTGCGALNNAGGAFQVITHTGDVAIPNITTAKAIAAKRNPDGSLPDITKL